MGGGFLGMTLAHRLAQQGKKVTLFEGGSQLGGLASAWNLGDVVWDRHYHVTLLSDTYLRSLLRELGLRKRNAVGRDPNWLLYRGKALFHVQHAGVSSFSPIRVLEQVETGRNYFLCFKNQRIGDAGEDTGCRLVDTMVG